MSCPGFEHPSLQEAPGLWANSHTLHMTVVLFMYQSASKSSCHLVLLMTVECIQWHLGSQALLLQTVWFVNRSIWQIFFSNSALDDKKDRSPLSHTNTNMAIFSKTAEQIKFVNRGITVLFSPFYICGNESQKILTIWPQKQATTTLWPWLSSLAVEGRCGVMAVVDPTKSITNYKTYSQVGSLLCFAQVDRLFSPLSFAVNK